MPARWRQEIGMDLFDDTTYQPHRLMYWPSTSSNGEYVFRVMDGDILDPDAYLGLYDDWRDVSTWPVSSRESEAVKKAAKQQADPLAKTGAVGAFCPYLPDPGGDRKVPAGCLRAVGDGRKV